MIIHSQKTIAMAALLSLTTIALAQDATKKGRDTQAGILLLAHGGRADWNDEVRKVAAQADKTMPTEVAFGMASKAAMQDAIDRLAQRGVGEIIAVPLFVSSHSSVIT